MHNHFFPWIVVFQWKEYTPPNNDSKHLLGRNERSALGIKRSHEYLNLKPDHVSFQRAFFCEETVAINWHPKGFEPKISSGQAARIPPCCLFWRHAWDPLALGMPLLSIKFVTTSPILVDLFSTSAAYCLHIFSHCWKHNFLSLSDLVFQPLTVSWVGCFHLCWFHLFFLTFFLSSHLFMIRFVDHPLASFHFIIMYGRACSHFVWRTWLLHIVSLCLFISFSPQTYFLLCCLIHPCHLYLTYHISHSNRIFYTFFDSIK